MFTFPFKYDYIANMKSDISEYLADAKITLNDDNYEDIYDELFDRDEITGNTSGSYTMDRDTARAMVIENIDILKSAVVEYYVNADMVSNWFLTNNWEAFDVVIRCHLLREAMTVLQNEWREA